MSQTTPGTDLIEPPKYTGTLGRCDVPPTFALQMQMATVLAESGDMVPARFRDRPGAVFAAMQHAKALDITVWLALHRTFVTDDGDHGMYADLMHGLVVRAGHEVIPESVTPARVSEDGKTVTGQCTLRLKRWDKPHGDYVESFTMEQARTAILLHKKNWVRYPDDMLYARALARLIRRYAREYVLGFGYLPDEIDRVNTTDPLDRQFVVADQQLADEVAKLVTEANADGITHHDIYQLGVAAQKKHLMGQVTADGVTVRTFLKQRYRDLAPATDDADGDQGEHDADGDPVPPAAPAQVVLGTSPALACGCVKLEVVANGAHRVGCALRHDTPPVAASGDHGRRAVVIDAEDPFARHAGVDEVEW